MAVDNVPPVRLNIPKLKDANLADSPSSESCTLLLTEGDSAKLFVEAGLPFVDKDKYGVFPLKGMLLNVRDANRQQLLKNAEIQNIKKILGLQDGKDYKDVKGLRYGHLVIMADQDHAGAHIKGLIINMFDCLWPSLLKVKKFMQMFITPIATASHKQTKERTLFYTMSEFDEWQSGNNATDYNIKYYKGLATFEDKEAEQFFKKFQEHVKDFEWLDDDDSNAIERAFSGKDIDKKRKWLLEEREAGTSYYSNGNPIRYLDFINNEVRQALLDDGQRTIPSMVDGFRRSQRKVFHCALEDPEIQETNVLVETFSGLVAKQTFYRHGQSSLDGVMIGMAQNFVGCNNINLLLPSGQFGTRVEGRKTHGGGRYVHTRLSPIALYIFHKDDKLILNYLYDGGKSIEPSRFYPIIPMILVNGTEGIAPGWSSFIPHYNPRDIIANLICLLNNQEVKPMLAWYKGFNGDIREISTGYITKGKIFEDNSVIRITELPIRMWKKDYETTLEKLKGKKGIKSYTALNSNTNDVHYEITMPKDQMKSAKREGWLLNKFKLTTKLSTTNMNLIDENGKIKKYGTPIEILKDFFYIRLECYERRKVVVLHELKKAYFLLESKIRYIKEVSKGTVLVYAEKAEKFAQLRVKKFNTLPSIAKLADRVGWEQTQTQEEEEVAEMFPETGYDYLLSIPMESMSNLTLVKYKEEMDTKKKDFDELEGTSSKQLWLRDLGDLTDQLDAFDL